MMHWLVTLAGSEADLYRLVELPDGEGWQVMRHEKGGVVLCSQRFEILDDYAAVGEAAEAIISDINRAATFVLPDFQGVHRGHTVEQRQERDHVILPLGLAVEASGVASLGWVKLAPDGTVIETSENREKQQQAKDYAKLVALLETHPDLADAIRYLEEEPDLRGYYKPGLSSNSPKLSRPHRGSRVPTLASDRACPAGQLSCSRIICEAIPATKPQARGGVKSRLP